MLSRRQFSLKALLIVTTFWCVLLAVAVTTPFRIVFAVCAPLVLMIAAILAILFPIRFAFDALDWVVARMKRDRLD